MSDRISADEARRLVDIRRWRDQTEGIYGLPHYPSDPPMVCNNKGWWQDVDALLGEVERLEADNQQLREALDQAQLDCIEARNPGIDMDEVRRQRAALSVEGDTSE